MLAAAWIALVAALPLVVDHGLASPFELARAAVLILAGAPLLILVALRRPVPESRFLAPLLLLAGASWLSALVSRDPDMAIFGSYSRQYGAGAVSLLVGLGVAGLAVLRSPRAARAALFAWSLTAAAVGGHALVESFYRPRPVGLFGNPDFLGVFLAVSLPSALALAAQELTREPLRLLRAVAATHAAALILAGIAVAQTRTAWVALLVVGAAAVWSRKGAPGAALGAAALVLAAAVVVAALAPGAGNGEGGRPYLWRQGLEVISEAPVLGVGWGNYQREAAPLKPAVLEAILPDAQADNPHNLYLGVWAQAGALGLAALLLLLWRLVRAGGDAPPLRRAVAAGAAVYAVVGLGCWDTIANTLGLIVLVVAAAALEPASPGPDPLARRALAVIGLVGLLCAPELAARGRADRAFAAGRWTEAAAAGAPQHELALASRLVQAGHPAAARPWLLRALRDADAPENAWLGLAMAYASEGRRVEAERAMRGALVWAPHSRPARALLASLRQPPAEP